MSCLTEHVTIAAVSTYGLLILLWIVDLAGTISGEAQQNTLQHISILKHYQVFLTGIVDSYDVAYFLLFIITFIILSIRRLDSYRLQH